MTQRNNSTENRLHHLWQQCLSTRRFASTLPAQSLAWLGSISMLSNGGLVFAQTESQIDNIVPSVESSQPAPAANTFQKNTVEPEAARSQFSQRRARLRQRLSKSKASNPTVVIRSRPQAENSRPEVAIRRSKPRVEVSVSSDVRKLRARVRSEAARSTSQILREEKPQGEASQPSATLRQDRQESQKNDSSASSTGKDYNNSYIDPIEYQAGATNKYQAPNSVVITERSSACKTIVGQGVASSICAKPYQNVANSNNGVSPRKAPSWLRRSKPTTLATVGLRRVANEKSSPVRPTSRVASGVVSRSLMRHTSEMATGSVTKSTYRSNRFIPNNFNPTTTVSSVPIAPAGGSLPAPMTAENVAPRASNVTYDIPLAAVLPQINYGGVYGGRLASGTGLMYPLSVPSAMTSLFGWRVHPITGNRRFHSGTDIGAAMGTPVLAAYSGKVEIADWMGGYGMTVILNHSNAQQTLYGHMSEIFVQPGQLVEQGTVIGRVGSTGNSTGPHLHFEVRQLTPEGWVATDPGAQLESALGQLVQSLHTAQATRQPGS